ncbi:hypothetical protein [uncultured Cohaesibacter sp.]|uniref:hypothetical protein n=1 Tax=uncultured Cohaesibacter sp. TaxID=1002546 RepID=UPI00292E638A|nr:hypothetical protein [uncultured Cohaesibacter sp.]
MKKSLFIAFCKDDNASVALEYAVLVGTIGLIWMSIANRYEQELNQLYHDITRELIRIRF